ncbi:MAG: hypothetical protein JST53_06630 [Actinobacteria bacterium]|nr:hypothetical protein [Actinomycetota bacterium]
MRSLAATLSCVLAFVGGGATGASAAPTSVHDFSLAYKRSGGIASSTQALAVREGRFATVTTSSSSAGSHRTRFRLPIRDVLSLQKGLTRAHLGSIPPRGPGGCADCFAYNLRYQGLHVELEEIDVPARLREVFDQIDAIIDAHT